MNAKELDLNYFYNGDDLGLSYSKHKSVFKLWAPTASSVELKLYSEGEGENLLKKLPMTRLEKGIWSCEINDDLNGLFYTYGLVIQSEYHEVVDIYAKAVGVNGKRGMVVDLQETDPDGFSDDVRPRFSGYDTDAIIYEVHMRDFSVDESSGIKDKGKFLGLIEKGTTNSYGNKTGIDHMIDLGVTHVQIQPSYDYATVDESNLDNKQYNWGYDPKNYNAPEGSYSTDPYDGKVRIREMKQMIMGLHKEGLRVNMDVVYNHTFDIIDSWFHNTVPDYYHRLTDDGRYSNGSGCGNETASDHKMMRKYMIDSVCYWAKEYHIDGFRFDLMGIHDIQTMNEIREALDKIDPTIMVYGEGWAGGTVAYSDDKLALKKNIYLMERVGAFNDDIRDAIKGNVFLSKDTGFVNGKTGMEESIKFSVVGAVKHPQISESIHDWAKDPVQSINYVSCHDNYTLWDKLALSCEKESVENRIKMNKLAAAIIMTSQGVPFFLAGEEMLRTKPGNKEEKFVENSYCSSDEINSIKWNDRTKHSEVYEYYKGLIELRKTYDCFRLRTAKEVQTKVNFIKNTPPNVVAFEIDSMFVIYNANKNNISFNMPEGQWDILVNDIEAGNKVINTITSSTIISGISAQVLIKK